MNFDRTPSAFAAAAAPSRIEEQAKEITEIYARIARFSELESRAEKIGIRFANNPEAARLKTRIGSEVYRLDEEALRRQAAISLEDVTCDEDVVRLMATVSWHLDNSDDSSREIVENAWNAVLEYHLKKTNIEADGHGFEDIKARKASIQVIAEQLSQFERLAAMADAETEKQTRRDLQRRLIAIFLANKEANEKANVKDDDFAATEAGEEYILNLRSDDPLVIAAKLIVTMTGGILRDLKSEIRDTRAAAEAALSALRLFEIESLYHECYQGDGATDD